MHYFYSDSYSIILSGQKPKHTSSLPIPRLELRLFTPVDKHICPGHRPGLPLQPCTWVSRESVVLCWRCTCPALQPQCPQQTRGIICICLTVYIQSVLERHNSTACAGAVRPLAATKPSTASNRAWAAIQLWKMEKWQQRDTQGRLSLGLNAFNCLLFIIMVTYNRSLYNQLLQTNKAKTNPNQPNTQKWKTISNQQG